MYNFLRNNNIVTNCIYKYFPVFSINVEYFWDYLTENVYIIMVKYRARHLVENDFEKIAFNVENTKIVITGNNNKRDTKTNQHQLRI